MSKATRTPRLLLFNPPSSESRKPVLPMSLLALGAVLEPEYDYRIVDGNLVDDALAALEHGVRDYGAEVLCVTVMPGPQLSHAVPVSRQLKERFPELVVVWGGYFPTQHWDVCLRSDYVDFVVRGHGELVLKRLLDRLRDGESPRDLDGIAFRDPAGGEPRSNPMAEIPPPDELPEYPYHRVDVGRYVRRTFLGKRTLPHHSSYGCPFRCNFCAVVNMVDGAWLAESAARTAATVRRLVDEWQIDAVEFYDNNFFTREARTLEFAERISDLGLGWWGEARIDTLLKYSDRSWNVMRSSGLRMVFLGAESGSDETLDRMRKGGHATTAKTLEIARRMRDLGIVPEMSFVLGSPPAPEEDAHRTLEFIRELKRVNPQTEIILYLYTPVPLAGTLFEEATAQGFSFPSDLDEWVDQNWLDFAQRRSDLPWIGEGLRREIRDFEKVLNAYYPTATDPRLRGSFRSLLRAAGGWRYRLQFYRWPYELGLLQRLVSYRRPETAGF